MTLEEELRSAAAKGMTHLTLYSEQSADRKTTYWCARAAPSTGHQYVSATDMDPIKVLMVVMELLPKAKKRVTAAVTGDEAPRIDTNRGKKYEDHPVGLNENIGSTTRKRATTKLDDLDPPQQEELDNWLPKA